MEELPVFEPTVNYCGAKLEFQEAFNEEVMPNWDNEVQAIIDDLRQDRIKACVIHMEKWHGLYSE